MRLFLGLALALSFVGCTSTTTNPVATVGCSAETVVTTAVAAAIATTDGCANTAQIQSDIQSALGGANLCQAAAVQTQLAKVAKKSSVEGKDKGFIASIVCPIAVDSIMTFIGQKVPATWQCSGSTSVSGAISVACLALPI